MLKQLIIRDKKAAAAFASPRTRRILFALMRFELSPVELQVEVGMSLSLLHYHLRSLKDLGLIEVVQTRPRAGRAISRYRATAMEFMMPAALADRMPGAGLKQELDAALEQAEARHPSSICYFLDEHGTARMRRTGVELAPTNERWWRLRLSAAAARKLNREIADLVAAYEDAATESGPLHLIHFAMVQSKDQQTSGATSKPSR